MNKRLVWNFEINEDYLLKFPDIIASPKNDEKWEARFFWPETSVIVLQGLDERALYLSKYQIKHKEDIYYLLQDSDANFKERKGHLYYKPLLKQCNGFSAYGKKIKIEHAEEHLAKELPKFHEIPRFTRNDAIIVSKENLSYQFATNIPCKMELAWLKVLNRRFYSLSIESTSYELVSSISRQLMGEKTPQDYVTFLKGL